MNKPKKNFANRPNASGKDGKPRLQLKGRIFMQNVTEAVSLGKPGTLPCSILADLIEANNNQGRTRARSFGRGIQVLKTSLSSSTPKKS